MRSILAAAAVAVAFTFTAGAPAFAKPGCEASARVCKGYHTASKGKVAAQHRKHGKKVAHKRARGTTRVASHAFSGKASYYWQPQRVASGGWFNPNAMTAAHKTLPFGTKVRVTNRVNGKSVVVTINDRGPYIAGRVIDLSKAAARAISMTGMGVAPVQVAVLGRG